MNNKQELQLFLIPEPGKKPEFLATIIQPVGIGNNNNNKGDHHGDGDNDQQQRRQQLLSDDVWESIMIQQQPNPPKIVLEGYTRDEWATCKRHSSCWTTITVVEKLSTERKPKLPGFVQYLKQRQKSCYGRFLDNGVFVIPHNIQSSNSSSQFFPMHCMIANDIDKIPNCNLRPLQQTQQQTQRPTTGAAQPQQQSSSSGSRSAVSATTSATSGAVNNKKKKKSGSGLLGKLVGAQQRTNQHVAVATTTTAASTAVAAAAAATNANTSTNNNKTAQEIFVDFRNMLSDKMLDFDMDTNADVLKVPVVLSEYTKDIASEQEKTKITMETLKFMIYEAAEEVNEEWIAYKEPSEFIDEIVIAVYKENADIPPEVLEDINKAELPEEIRGQQQALQQERARQIAQAESKHKKSVEQMAHQEQQTYDDDFETLNTKKRDRRTIEDYERERKKR